MLNAGYSKKTVKANVQTLRADGVPLPNALAAAYALGRKSYFARHPAGALPSWLAIGPGKRLAQHYDDRGEPLKSNPSEPVMRAAAAAARRFKAFTGAAVSKVLRVKNAPISAALAIGPLLAVEYETVRDGVRERYRHTFKKEARPLLAASSDGRQLVLIGGSYRFKDTGINDG